MPKIVHFEIPTDNLERAKKFHSDLFGWTFQQWQGHVEYRLITMEKDGKVIAGGLTKRQNRQQSSFLHYIDVLSVDEYSVRIKKLNGEVTVPKIPVLTMGYFAICTDTVNNLFAI